MIISRLRAIIIYKNLLLFSVFFIHITVNLKQLLPIFELKPLNCENLYIAILTEFETIFPS